jgi:hypothetical protein
MVPVAFITAPDTRKARQGSTYSLRTPMTRGSGYAVYQALKRRWVNAARLFRTYL